MVLTPFGCQHLQAVRHQAASTQQAPSSARVVRFHHLSCDSSLLLQNVLRSRGQVLRVLRARHRSGRCLVHTSGCASTAGLGGRPGREAAASHRAHRRPPHGRSSLGGSSAMLSSARSAPRRSPGSRLARATSRLVTPQSEGRPIPSPARTAAPQRTAVYKRRPGAPRAPAARCPRSCAVRARPFPQSPGPPPPQPVPLPRPPPRSQDEAAKPGPPPSQPDRPTRARRAGGVGRRGRGRKHVVQGAGRTVPLPARRVPVRPAVSMRAAPPCPLPPPAPARPRSLPAPRRRSPVVPVPPGPAPWPGASLPPRRSRPGPRVSPGAGRAGSRGAAFALCRD